VLFDPYTVIDTATFADPVQPGKGISRVWVNGVLSYTAEGPTGNRAGRFLPRQNTGSNHSVPTNAEVTPRA